MMSIVNHYQKYCTNPVATQLSMYDTGRLANMMEINHWLPTTSEWNPLDPYPSCIALTVPPTDEGHKSKCNMGYLCWMSPHLCWWSHWLGKPISKLQCMVMSDASLTRLKVLTYVPYIIWPWRIIQTSQYHPNHLTTLRTWEGFIQTLPSGHPWKGTIPPR